MYKICYLFLNVVLLTLAVQGAVPRGESGGQCEGKPNYARVEVGGDSECKSYYECFDGKGFVEKCPEKYHFNSETMLCDWQKNTKCNDGAGGTDPDECKGKDSGSKIAGSDCFSYYTCTAAGKSDDPIECPTEEDQKKIFNPYVGDCVNRNTWWCPENDNDRPKCSELLNDTRVFDPKSCGNFYYCYGGGLTLDSCPTGQRYDFRRGRCTTDGAADCLGSGGAGGSGSDICVGNKGKFISDPNICKAYIWCIDDNLPFQAFCANDTPYFTGHSCSKQPQPGCSCEDDEYDTSPKYYENGEDPNYYWRCDEDGPTEMQCPSGFVFTNGLCQRK